MKYKCALCGSQTTNPTIIDWCALCKRLVCRACRRDHEKKHPASD